MTARYFHEPTTPDRGIAYADGGIAGTDVHYPDPARMAAINAEWQHISDTDGVGETNPNQEKAQAS